MMNRRLLPLAVLGSVLAPRAFAQPLPPPGGGGSFTGGSVSGATAFGAGISFGSTAAVAADLSHHIALYGTGIGFNATSGGVNFVAGATAIGNFTATGWVFLGTVKINANLGFYNTTPIAKQTVSGAWAGNTAGKALTTALAAYGLIVDSTSA